MGTNTPNYNLYKPGVGEQGWGNLVNANCDILDSHAAKHQKGGADELSLDASQIVSGTLPIAQIPTATTSSKGIVQVGNNIDVDTSGVLSVKDASDSEKGVVEIGTGLSIGPDGKLSTNIASTTDVGVVKVGDGLEIASDGTLKTKGGSDMKTILIEMQSTGDGIRLCDWLTYSNGNMKRAEGLIPCELINLYTSSTETLMFVTNMNKNIRYHIKGYWWTNATNSISVYYRDCSGAYNEGTYTSSPITYNTSYASKSGNDVDFYCTDFYITEKLYDSIFTFSPKVSYE